MRAGLSLSEASEYLNELRRKARRDGYHQRAGELEDEIRALIPDFNLGPVALPCIRPSWLPKIKVAPCNDNELIGPCWLWQGACDSYGYSVVSIGPRATRKFWSLHRWVFYNLHGPIPVDFDIDHKCRQRPCFQPNHLRAMPMMDNRAPFRDRSEVKLSPEDLAALADGHWLTVLRPRMLI